MSSQSSNSTTIQTTPCDLCRSTEATVLFDTKDRLGLTTKLFQIAECAGCGVMRTLPAMSEEELSEFYPDEYWGGVPTEKWIRSSQSDKTAFIRACRLSGGRILDVGCGAGFFLRALRGKEWERHGIEVGEKAARAAAGLLASKNIVRATLIDAAFESETFDVVTFWSSLEHTNEPRKSLVEARRILKPGGTLVVQVPNAAGYQARQFKGDWFALDAPRHRYHFTPTSLNRILDEAGFATYRTTFQSKAHNAHALRQSLKVRLWRRSFLHRKAFLLAIPFIKPFDYLMSKSDQGATITVAARAV